MKQRKTVRLAGPFSVEALIETYPDNSSKVLGYNIRGPAPAATGSHDRFPAHAINKSVARRSMRRTVKPNSRQRRCGNGRSQAARQFDLSSALFWSAASK